MVSGHAMLTLLKAVTLSSLVKADSIKKYNRININKEQAEITTYSAFHPSGVGKSSTGLYGWG